MWIRIPKDQCSPRSFVTGGQVSRVDPDSVGLNPAWRNSLAYITLGTTWQEGANEATINAARQGLIQDMKTLEAIAPDSGAYFNEVILSLHILHDASDLLPDPFLSLLPVACVRVGLEIRI